MWVRHEAQEVKVFGLWPLLLHDVNVQEKRGAGAVVWVLVSCDWVMMTGVVVGAGSARWCGLGATAGPEGRCDRPCPCGACFDDNPDRQEGEYSPHRETTRPMPLRACKKRIIALN